ncbi:MAG: hypothetical protein U0270_15175 [Labilithrix sp.]
MSGGFTRLDRVTPAEVAATYAAGLRDDIARCIQGNPAISAVDAGNLGAFYRPGVQSFWGVKYAVEGMLAVPGVTSIPVASLGDAVGPWAERVMSAHVDADGFYVPTDETFTFYEAEQVTREQKAISLAARPGGKSLADIRAMWAEVQRVQGNLDSAWLNPVKASSADPSLGEVKKAMGIRDEADMAAWGNDAVAQFHQASEGPDEAVEFDAIEAFLRTSAIKKRWYFVDGGNEWSSNTLVVLDEHNQLWGMQMGYSE